MAEDIDDPDFSEVCLAGGDLTEFSATKLGPYIRRIDLSFNSLMRVSPRGFEVCSTTLEELILDNNQLECIEFTTQFPKLHTLSINKNRIWDITALITNLKLNAISLRYLSLLGNPVCPDQLTDDHVDETDYEVYRCHILFHLPNLRFLDHRPVTRKELKESQHMSYENIRITPYYSPLPGLMNGKNGLKNSKGRNGKRRYKYVGKNSEGNRFIQDSDL